MDIRRFLERFIDTSNLTDKQLQILIDRSAAVKQERKIAVNLFKQRKEVLE